MALTLRSVVNRPLTYAELDGNFTYLLNLIQAIPNLPADLLVDGIFNLDYAPELQLQDGLANKGVSGTDILGIDFTNATFETNIQSIAGGTPVTPVPDAPVLTAGSPTSTGVPFTWTKPANTVSFVFQRATNSGFTNGVTTIYSSTAQSFPDSGLTPSTPYFYRIAGVNATGQGAWSTVVSVITVASGGGGGGNLITNFNRMDLLLPQKLSAGPNATLVSNKYVAQSGEFRTVTPYKLPIGSYCGIFLTSATNVSVRVHNAYNIDAGSYFFSYNSGVLSASVTVSSQPALGDLVLFLRSGTGNGSLSIVKTSDLGVSYQTIASGMDLFASDQWVGFDIQNAGEASDPQISTVILDPAS